MKIRVSISRIGILFSVWLLILISLLLVQSGVQYHSKVSADSYFLTSFLQTSQKQLQDQAKAGTIIRQFEEWRRGGILHYRLKTDVLTIGDISNLVLLEDDIGPDISLAEAVVKNQPRILMVAQLVLPNKNTLVYGFDYTEHYRAEQVIFWVRLTLFITLGVGAIGGLIASTYILRRVRSINELCDDVIKGGNLNQRIPIRGQEKEFDSLAQHINRMLSQVSDTMTAVKSVSDNIAHDLCTPLTRLRNLLEETREDTRDPSAEKALDRATEEVDQLLQVFNAALNIASLEAGQPHNSEPFDLDELLHAAVDMYSPLAEDQHQQLHLTTPVVRLRANRQLIFQCISNLLENAIKYAHNGERIEINVSSDKQWVDIEVRDFGPGLPEDELTHLTRRFYRSASTQQKPGTGLGLSLVQAIVTAHQGTLGIENAEPGLRFIIRLPLAGPEQNKS